LFAVVRVVTSLFVFSKRYFTSILKVEFNSREDEYDSEHEIHPTIIKI